VSAAPGWSAAGRPAQRRPCARLLAGARGAGAGAALRTDAAGRALQRLALARLGRAAEPLPPGDGRAARLALAGGRLRTRVPGAGRGAAGGADARLDLAG